MNDANSREVRNVIFLHWFLFLATSSVMRYAQEVFSEPVKLLYELPMNGLVAYVLTKLKFLDELLKKPAYTELSIRELRMRFGVHLAIRYGAAASLISLVLSWL